MYNTGLFLTHGPCIGNNDKLTTKSNLTQWSETNFSANTLTFVSITFDGFSALQFVSFLVMAQSINVETQVIDVFNAISDDHVFMNQIWLRQVGPSLHLEKNYIIVITGGFPNNETTKKTNFMKIEEIQ